MQRNVLQGGHLSLTLEVTVVAPDAASFEIHGLHVAALVRRKVHDGVVLEAELPEGVHQRPDALVHLLHVVAIAGTGLLTRTHMCIYYIHTHLHVFMHLCS